MGWWPGRSIRFRSSNKSEMRIRVKSLFLVAATILVSAMAASPPAFEIASIRPQPWTNEGGVFVYVRGNTLYGEHADLYSLVDFAYGLRPDDLQLSGGPAWAKRGVLSNVSGEDSMLSQVIAKAPEGADAVSWHSSARCCRRAAGRSLPVARASCGMKDLAVFRLTIAKDGLKLKESAPGAKNSLAMNDYGGKAFRMSAVHVPVSDLVEELAYATGKPVIDATGLAAGFTISRSHGRLNLRTRMWRLIPTSIRRRLRCSPLSSRGWG